MASPIVSAAANEEDVYRFPASYAQQRLWVLDQLEPSSPVYNIPTAVRLRGPLDVGALQQSVDAIVHRHETLRTTFASVEGYPMQVIAPVLRVPLRVVDLRDLPTAEREAAAARLAVQGARQPFDLAQAPLLRTTLLRLDTEDHILLVTIHHIVSDDWSVGVFMRELATLYSAQVRSRPAALPELPIQYADYTLWQREWLQGEVLEAQLAYWRAQLAGAPAVLELPTDRPRPPGQSFRGATHSFALPLGLSQALRQLSRQEGVTLFMTLLAAFQVLLARYTGQDDIVVGSPIAGRTRTELEHLIGFFVNTLVLRTDLAGTPPLRELLGRVREVTLGAYGHQELPFERLVEALQPARDLSRNPLFQVMFVLQNAPTQALELPRLTMEAYGVDKETAKFDLTLFMRETKQGLAGACEYSTDLFEAGTIARLIGHWQTLLEGIVADPTQRLSELPLLTEAEHRQLLVEWNETRAACPGDACLQELFEARVERTPDAVAVVCAEHQLSYREVNRRANQLAHYLCARGVGPEVRVGICVERSADMIVGLLGILKAGGAYVPLDPSYPKERLAFMLQDAHAPVLVTQRRLVAGLPEHVAQVVCLDTDWPAIADEDEDNPRSGVAPENLAYVIYTSGSTGKPKGVMVTHRNVANFFGAMDQRVERDPPGVWLAVTSISFDISVLELFWTLARGFRVVLFTGNETESPQDQETAGRHPVARLIEEHGVTHLQCTPSMASLLLDSPGSTSALGSLRQLLVGGEAFPAGLAHKLRAAMSGSILNMYGPTETTIWSSTFELGRADWSTVQTVPIGRPIANTQFYILDRQMRPVPVGVIGELFIGGDGVARGYLDRPELTAERFVADPFGDCPGSRLYRTGDLARYRDDGSVDYVGRIDNQVKLRGYRIELGEIESVLSMHPEVRENAVVVRGEGQGQQRLVAYVVGRTSAEDLRGYLADRLPEFMVPAAFEFLDTLPRTPNEKVDRLALPESTRSASDGRHVAPRDELERRLATIWEREFKIAPISMTDNFFHLGGDSLLAVRIFSQIEKSLGTRLPVATLFTVQTIEQLAAILRREGWSPAEVTVATSRSQRTRLVAVRRVARGASRIVFHAVLKRRLLRLGHYIQ